MTNKTSAPRRQPTPTDYLIAREYWLRRVLSNRNISQRAKVLASALYFYFNSEEFAKDGGLWAWPSIRTLNIATGQAKNTIAAAIEDLTIAGYLKPHHRYDPIRRRYKSHLYEALAPAAKKIDSTPKVAQVNPPPQKNGPNLTHPRSDGCTTLGQTGRTDSMNDYMNDSYMGSLASAPLGDALRSPIEESKGEFEGEHASQSDSSRDPPDKPYAHPDIEIVRSAIDDHGLTDIADIVGHARRKGRWLSESIIRAMCHDGLFPVLKAAPPAR